jgi:hypothetical protein
MHIKGAETRACPPEFQDRLTRMFGTNQFGDPLFKIVWGQSEFIRMGNVWRDRFGNERRGYRDRYKCHGSCWMIMRWRSPQEYATPDLYYQNTYDAYSGLYITGEYPWRGRYEVLQALRSSEMIDGKLTVTHFPLSHVLIDKIIPLMLYAQHMSAAEKKAAKELVEQAEHKKRVEETAEIMMENLPTWYGPVSFSNQGCRTSVLDQKMHKIQKQWDRISKGSRRPKFQQGFTLAKAPRITAFQ